MNGENDEPHGGGQEPTRETKGTSDRDAEGKRVRGEEDRSRMTDDGGLLRSLKSWSCRHLSRLLSALIRLSVSAPPFLPTRLIPSVFAS